MCRNRGDLKQHCEMNCSDSLGAMMCSRATSADFVPWFGASMSDARGRETEGMRKSV